jgi:16S rRNA processing protein RimM
VRGWVRVGSDSEALLDLDEVWLDDRRVKILEAEPERGDFLLRLEGVTDRTQAEALRGRPLYIDRASLPPPEPGELYVADLVGCEVFDLRGTRLGKVAGSFPGGGTEILVVEPAGEGEREFLLPLVDAIVKELDLSARRLVCDPPPGLIDLDEAEG